MHSSAVVVELILKYTKQTVPWNTFYPCFIHLKLSAGGKLSNPLRHNTFACQRPCFIAKLKCFQNSLKYTKLL